MRSSLRSAPRKVCGVYTNILYFPAEYAYDIVANGGVREARGEKSKQTQSSVTAGKKNTVCRQISSSIYLVSRKKTHGLFKHEIFFPTASTAVTLNIHFYFNWRGGQSDGASERAREIGAFSAGFRRVEKIKKWSFNPPRCFSSLHSALFSRILFGFF